MQVMEIVEEGVFERGSLTIATIRGSTHGLSTPEWQYPRRRGGKKPTGELQDRPRVAARLHHQQYIWARVLQFADAVVLFRMKFNKTTQSVHK